MSASAFALARYRLRATFYKNWSGYLAVVLLVGALGGLAMGSIAGARRTESAFPMYLATTNASNLQANIWNLGESINGPATKNLVRELTHLKGVKSVASAPSMLVLPLAPNGQPAPTAGAIEGDEVDIEGSTGGMYFRSDRVSVIAGRLARANSTSEMNATTLAAHFLHWHVGQVIRFAAYTPAQVQSPTFDPSAANASSVHSVKLVGLIEFTDQIASDDVDRLPSFVLMTPALTHLWQSSSALPFYGFTLTDGNSDVAAVEREIIHILPRSTVNAFHLTSIVTGQVQRASKPESFALGVFGAIAAMAALLIAGLTLARRLSADATDQSVLRAMGASSFTAALDASLGLLAAVLLGSLLALVVAVLLSPLTLIGPIRQVERSPGFAFDWTVLGIGVAVLVVGLGVFTCALAYRMATRRFGERHEPIEHRSSIVDAASRAGLSVAALVGLRFTLQRGRSQNSVPVRSVIVGAALAITVIVATVTFGSSLSTLNSHPALYGWNWNYALDTGAGGTVPPVAGQLLNHDPDVAKWTGFSFGDAQLNGLTVPLLSGQIRAPLSPPILSGHGLDANNQVVVGAATLAQLHKKVGDTIYFSYGAKKNAPVYIAPTPVVIVGSATFPAIGTSGTLHPSMGTGVLFANNAEPASFRRVTSSSDPNLNGPDIVVVRLRKGVSSRVGLASLRAISVKANKVLAADPDAAGDSTFVVGVQRPAEIVAYQSTGATPAVLSSALVVGAVVALGLALANSVRRRRRELALLKTLGFTQRQLATTVAWQASLTAFVGVIVGVPAGIALGRWLWILFAREIYAVPEPTVPVLQVVLIAFGALLVANIVAALPGRIAARTSTAMVLRAE